MIDPSGMIKVVLDARCMTILLSLDLDSNHPVHKAGMTANKTQMVVRTTVLSMNEAEVAVNVQLALEAWVLCVREKPVRRSHQRHEAHW